VTLYAHVTLNQDYPPRERPGVLHLHSGEVSSAGYVNVTSASDFAAFVAKQELGWAIVYDSRFPQRGRRWADFIAKDACKLWSEKELLAAFREAKRRQMADPKCTPTVAEALADPKGFVEGMMEE
jgi:hypothetical protein